MRQTLADFVPVGESSAETHDLPWKNSCHPLIIMLLLCLMLEQTYE